MSLVGRLTSALRVRPVWQFVRPFHACAARFAGKYDDDDDGSGGGEHEEREGRPFPDPKASRRIEEIRSSPKHKKWGGFIDILEHSAYCNKVREADGDGFLFDHTVAPGESECDEDPFCNGYLTEDEIEFDEDYVPADYLPDAVKTRIYYLYSQRGWDVKRCAEKYGLSTVRVSAIINLKATEPEMVKSGRCRDEVDLALAQMYSGRHKYSLTGEPSFDMGVDVEMLQDNEIPSEVTPRIPAALRGNVLRLPKQITKFTPPPVAQRVVRSRFVFKDISANPNRKDSAAMMLDYSGERRPLTPMEADTRSWVHKYAAVEKAISPGFDVPNPFKQLGPGGPGWKGKKAAVLSAAAASNALKTKGPRKAKRASARQ